MFMSNNAFIVRADEELSNLIWNGINSDPEVKSILTSKDQIGFCLPKMAKAQSALKLSIVLYNVTLNEATKNRSIANSQPGRGLDATVGLSYLVTPCTGKEADDHLLLGSIIQAALITPIITSQGEEKMAITIDSMSTNELAGLWTALGLPLKPSVSLTLLPIIQYEAQVLPQRETAPKLAVSATKESDKKVFDLYQAVVKSFSEQFGDLKNRNFIQKQYIQMDFKKNTGTTPEQMLRELRDLGERIESKRSVEPCIDTLKQLEEYYGHQQELLKGFDKVQKKRKEGIDLVGSMRREVQSLLEALQEKS